MDRLLIAVLGNRNSGKSRTWNTLFGQTVRTGKEVRSLEVAKGAYVDVFLVSGSPEERELCVGDIVKKAKPRIVLCSVQYVADAHKTFDYFIENDYSLFVHWLNPGHSDSSQCADVLGILNSLLYQQASVAIRDGKDNPESRVRELRELIHGWALSRGLVHP
jgi:hypothetical protein